ncbi:MAG: hypothetical protein SFV21_05875 [Rhodospirillaceae bacterium]|nr:hypothetical protein [Rhodospirillaceae bacterium]
MKVFAVACFFFGVVALGILTVRRGRRVPPSWPDYALGFVGLAGSIAGVILLFNRF